MKKTKKLIVANWKMNPRTIDEAKDLFRKVRITVRGLRRVQAVVCPPFVFLSEMSKLVNSRLCVLGAQDVFWKEEGAYTGEISPLQLARLDANYVIVGHSERRALGETDEIINKKVRAALENNLFVVLCVGERERDPGGEYLHFIKDELKNSLAKVPKKDFSKIIIAYEPIWAVGSKAKHSDTPEALFEMSIFIRKVLNGLYGRSSAMDVPILYGGSVDADNAGVFLSAGGIQGLLVGRASLDAKKFTTILKIADGVRN